jgi:hypothetical protein
MKRVLCIDNCMSAAVSSSVETAVKLVNDEFGNKAELFQPIVVRMLGFYWRERLSVRNGLGLSPFEAHRDEVLKD